MGPKLLFMTNKKLHMIFRLVPKSSTLNDLELLQVQIFSEFCATLRVWEATTAKRMKIDLIFSEGVVALKVYFSTMYRRRWYCLAFLPEGRFSELRPIYHGCRALTFALARLSCFMHYIPHDVVSCFCRFLQQLPYVDESQLAVWGKVRLQLFHFCVHELVTVQHLENLMIL